MKSNRPCPPAFMPVIMFDHATGLCGGILEVRRLNEPLCASVAKFGIFPSCMKRVSSWGSMPSMPKMMSFCPPCQCALPRWHEGNRATDVNANKQASSQTIFLRCLLLHLW